MRVRLIFGLVNKGAYVPFHHQYLIHEFLSTYIEQYFSSSPGKSSTSYYNFSALKGQTRVGKDGLHFYSSKITLILSSNDVKLLEFAVKKIFDEPQVMVGKLILNPLHADKEELPDFTNEMKYICLSPLSIISAADNNVDAKRFINPSLDVFSDALYETTMSRMEKAGFTQEELAQYFQFQLVPDKDYLNKIKGEEKKFARIFPVYMSGEKHEVRGYTFPFKLYAHPKVQEFVFTCGFGLYTDKGFGMLDIANSDPNKRVLPFIAAKEGASEV
ncbi:MAG: CRISPR-associated endoribonuclease Cas6 [Cytophagaceae bacterium]